MGYKLIKNIGKIVSGDIEKGIIEGADAILIKDDKIEAVGKKGDIKVDNLETVIDAQGMVVVPGFIDPHIHNTFDDYAPMRGTIGGYEDALLGGTTIIKTVAIYGNIIKNWDGKCTPTTCSDIWRESTNPKINAANTARYGFQRLKITIAKAIKPRPAIILSVNRASCVTEIIAPARPEVRPVNITQR
ncbi:Imidazolonepropionase [subsurface metagenome]